MKILVVAPNVNMGTLRGDAIHLRNVVGEWADDHEVHVVSMTDSLDCPKGVSVSVNSTATVGFLPDYVEEWLRAVLATVRLRVEHDYDLVYERHHFFGAGILGSIGADCPKVLEVNGSLVSERELRGNISPATARLLRGVERLVAGLADTVVCVSPGVAQDLRANGVDDRKLSIVANGCDTEMFRPRDGAKQELGWDLDASHVGFVGGLANWHGVGQVVEALPRVLEERPRTKFVIVGDGPLREEIEDRVGELGLDDHVELVGEVPHEEVPLYMSAFDVATILKHPDIPGSPLKLYEYLACGTPVVATDHVDFDLLDGTDAGEKARYDDPKDVARAVVTLLDSGPDASRTARSLALDQSWEMVAKRVLDVAME